LGEAIVGQDVEEGIEVSLVHDAGCTTLARVDPLYVIFRPLSVQLLQHLRLGVASKTKDNLRSRKRDCDLVVARDGMRRSSTKKFGLPGGSGEEGLDVCGVSGVCNLNIVRFRNDSDFTRVPDGETLETACEERRRGGNGVGDFATDVDHGVE
jgi:hypothetical protein